MFSSSALFFIWVNWIHNFFQGPENIVAYICKGRGYAIDNDVQVLEHPDQIVFTIQLSIHMHSFSRGPKWSPQSYEVGVKLCRNDLMLQMYLRTPVF